MEARCCRESKLQAGKAALSALQKKKSKSKSMEKKNSAKVPQAPASGDEIRDSSMMSSPTSVDVGAVANTIVDDKAKIACVCTSLEERALMLQCDVCDSWLHCDCLSISEVTAKAPNFPFVCPFCVKNAVPRLKTLVQELSTLQVEFVAFKTWVLSALQEAGVRVRSEVDRPEAASQASNSLPELAQQPESPAQVPFSLSDPYSVQEEQASTSSFDHTVINPPLPLSPLISPFVLCLWGTKKAATSVTVREALVEAFCGCDSVSFPKGLVCVRRRVTKKNGRKRWYHAILGEKVNFLAMQRCQFLLPDKWA